jgi:ring-1,2-phenylacetyl-CoA epoxidase subunit PaaE
VVSYNRMNTSDTPGLYHTLTIKDVREEVRNFKSFVLEAGEPLVYQAGQYLTLVNIVNGEEVRRSYSIASAPALGEPLTIGVKRVENGYFSRLLVDKGRTGNRLRSTGAGGFFTLPEDIEAYKQLFFFAAGSGITPIFSLIKTALHLYPHLKLVLIYSNASKEKAIFREALEGLEQQHAKALKIEFLYSNAANLGKARLYRELLLQLLEEHSCAPADQALFYICGPEAYMRMCLYTLQGEGIPSGNIRRENFVIQRTLPPKATPPDTGLHQVSLLLFGKEHHFPVQYPDTVLSAAKKEGLSLPYSCEVGRCGNCVALCTQGKVWLSYNEVLTDKDLAKGLILTCVAHPVEGDVHLEIK